MKKVTYKRSKTKAGVWVCIATINGESRIFANKKEAVKQVEFLNQIKQS